MNSTATRPALDDALPGALLRYVVVTPARNEGASIGATIESVISQTVRPVKYVVVSDGSTDNTDDVVRSYMVEHDWIELVTLPVRQERNFAGKVGAFDAGYSRCMQLDHDLVVSLDADITFEPDYFAFLLQKFVGNPRLGVAGTPFREGDFQYNYRFSSIEHVSGACQVFRRACFQEIGGYKAIKDGGIDLVAVVSARMKGWQTRSFPEKCCIHHRKMGTAAHRGLQVHFKWGEGDYKLGGHPVWQVFRCLYQMTNKPYVLGGSVCLLGYFWALLIQAPRSVSREITDFRGREQMRRLKQVFTRGNSEKN